MASFPTNARTQTAIYLSWAERGSELTRGGRGNSRKKLIEGVGRVRAEAEAGGGQRRGDGPRVPPPGPLPRYQTARPLSADGGSLRQVT